LLKIHIEKNAKNSTKTKKFKKTMKVVIGTDHASYEVKNSLATLLREKGYEVVDVSEADGTSVDYPDVAARVCHTVLSSEGSRGILLCGTGIGQSIAANKINGIRAALCHDHFTATMCRQHNDANVLCAGSRVTGPEVIFQMANVFLTTEFEGGRHERRVNKIMSLQTS
jgi:ribose 5-phosphate isomerase B